MIDWGALLKRGNNCCTTDGTSLSFQLTTFFNFEKFGLATSSEVTQVVVFAKKTSQLFKGNVSLHDRLNFEIVFKKLEFVFKNGWV